MKKVYGWVAAVLAATACIELLFYSRPGLGFTALFISVIPIYYLTYGFSKQRFFGELLFMAPIAALGSTYVLFCNSTLAFFNLVGFAVLVGALFLRPLLRDKGWWGRPLALLESTLGWLVRPFMALAAPWQETFKSKAGASIIETSVFAKHQAADDVLASAAEEARKKRRTIIGQVALAVVVSIPLMVILISLLASSDSIFAHIFNSINFRLSAIHIGDAAWHLFLIALLVPLTASMVWSYRTKKTLFSDLAVHDPKKNPAANPAGSDSASDTGRALLSAPFAITILTLVNLLYVVYAVVQFVYLFGGATGALPSDLTYAEYARSGFFELAAVSVINVVLVLVSIRFTTRAKPTASWIRGLALGLIALSAVQLVSALTRMNIYVQAYGLSELRLFVTIFMVLIGAIFCMLAVREFTPKVPLGRVTIYLVCATLLVANFIVPDALIARYNIDNYLAGSIKKLDLEYLWADLSYDADLVVLSREDALIKKNPKLKKSFARFHEGLKQSKKTQYAAGFSSELNAPLGIERYGYLNSYDTSWDAYNRAEEKYREAHGILKSEELSNEEYDELYEEVESSLEGKRVYVYPYKEMRSSWKNYNVSAWRLAEYIK